MNIYNQCHKCLLSKQPKIPRNALIYGKFKGAIPKQLQNLNVIEKSMISRKNCITKLIIPGGKHFNYPGEIYAIVNDVVAVHKSLPAMPTTLETCILKHHKMNGMSKEYVIHPLKVKSAIELLQKINPEWLNEVHSMNNYDNLESQFEPPRLEIGNDDFEDICYSDELPQTEKDNVKIPEETLVTLLMTPTPIMNQLEELREYMTSSNPSADLNKDNASSINIGSKHEFVSFHELSNMLFEHMFPCHFPYGKGGPSDPKSKDPSLENYAKSSLKQGKSSDGRRMQQDPMWIFIMYHRIYRLKLGGVALRAAVPGVVFDPTEQTDMTLEDYYEVVKTLHGPKNQNEKDKVGLDILGLSMRTADKKINHLVNRLVPFSHILRGSSPYFQDQKKK